MAQATGQRNKQAHLSTVLEMTAEWQIQLPPLTGYPNGWAGSVKQFLLHIHEGTFSLECVPLASVVDQYLAQISALTLEQAGELLDVVASLIYWKSRLLLPYYPFLADVEGDPRQEIISGLQEGEHRRRGGKTLRATTAEPDRAPAASSETSLLDLFVLLNEVEQSLLTDSSYQILAPPVTVVDQLQWLAQHFTEQKSLTATADSLFLRHSSQQAKICLLLALLEMAKRGQLRLDQTSAFDAIAVSVLKA
jgi:chromatin segregation and condensation protein Rec8/ScpA/Scc1 (kleisin family)